jgi:hypothetical protein
MQKVANKTNSMELSPSSEAANAATQEVPSILWTQKVL